MLSSFPWTKCKHLFPMGTQVRPSAGQSARERRFLSDINLMQNRTEDQTINITCSAINFVLSIKSHNSWIQSRWPCVSLICPTLHHSDVWVRRGWAVVLQSTVTKKNTSFRKKKDYWANSTASSNSSACVSKYSLSCCKVSQRTLPTLPGPTCYVTKVKSSKV